MATAYLPIYCISGTQAASDWLYPERVFDSDEITYAQLTVSGTTAKHTDKWIKGTVVDLKTAPPCYITDVSVKMKISSSRYYHSYFYVMPLFNGTASGTEYQITPPLTPSVSGVSIFTDSLIDGRWTWEDIEDLDILVYTETTTDSGTIFRIHNLYLEVATPYYTITMPFSTTIDSSSAWTNDANLIDTPSGTTTYTYRSVAAYTFGINNTITASGHTNWPFVDDTDFMLCSQSYPVYINYIVGVENANMNIAHYLTVTGTVLGGGLSYKGTPGAPPTSPGSASIPWYPVETPFTTPYYYLAPSVASGMAITFYAENTSTPAYNAYLFDTTFTFNYVRTLPSGIYIDEGVEGSNPPGGSDNDEDEDPDVDFTLYYYNNGVEMYSNGLPWTNPSYVWNNTLNTYATTSLTKNKSSRKLWLTSNTVVSGTEIPRTVMVGVKCKTSVAADNIVIKLQAGTQSTIYYIKPETTYSTYWVEIIADDWDWVDIPALPVYVWATNNSDSTPTISIDRVYIMVGTGVYGLEVYDSTGSKTLSVTDRITRLVGSFVATAGNSSSTTYSGLAARMGYTKPLAYAYPLDPLKCVHNVYAYNSGDDVIVEVTSSALTGFGESLMASGDSHIIVMGY